MSAARVLFVFPAALIVVLAAIPVAAAPDAKAVPNFTLTDSAGKKWTLHEQKAKAVVAAFLSTDCPMANGYLPVLGDIAAKYAEKGVVLIGVYPDPEESADHLAAHANEYKVSFPVFRDPTHAAVSPLGGMVTPEVVVLDEKFAVRYRGRIDDRYVSRLKLKATVSRHDLTEALDEILAGKAVTVAETKAFGCAIPAPEKKAVDLAAPVSYYKDVAPLLQAHCQSCHRSGQVGPFVLTTYAQAKKWAGACLEEVTAKRMPPWKPEANPLLAGERLLPAEAIKTLQRWVDQGMPEGDPKDAPPAAKFPEGWSLGEPDLVLESPDEVTVAADGGDIFRVLVFPTNLPEDRYVTAMEVRPGNPRVVHHTLQMIDTTGRAKKLQSAAEANRKPTDRDRGPGYSVSMGWGFFPDPANILGGWAPGMLPKPLPDGVGQKLPKGADLALQIHYHRTGKEEKDRTKVGLYFAKKPVTEPFRSLAVTGMFTIIPAGEKAYKIESSWKVNADLTVYRLVPHMHLLGKDIELVATLPGEKERTLIRLPEWDYNWQEQYQLKEPLKLPKGTVLQIRATFDNSATNPNNPTRPPKPVRLGEQTTDEMCFVFLGISSPNSLWRLLSPVGKLFPD